MSLYAYCKKASDGLQKSHCKGNKCISCIVEIAKVKAIWKERGYEKNN
jgi:hypothetical protein